MTPFYSSVERPLPFPSPSVARFIARSTSHAAAARTTVCRPPRASGSSEASSPPQQLPDAFSLLDDRKDLPPLPLPAAHRAARARAFLVRHGQSTWNAIGRIQGSSDESELTEKGLDQARRAADALADVRFDVGFASPLHRARDTADIVWGPRPSQNLHTLPSLREVDLYSFQGLDKAEGKAKWGALYDAWQRRPADFEIDGHAPVRELWYRASLAWREVLPPLLALAAASSNASPGPSALLASHNAVNQAMVCCALGLGPVHFRRLAQGNGGHSIVAFHWPASGAMPLATLEKLNQGPSMPKPGNGARLVLVARETGSSGGNGTDDVSRRAEEVLDELAAALSDGGTVMASAPPADCAAIVAKCLGAPGLAKGALAVEEGGMTLLDYKAGAKDVTKGVLTCLNCFY